MAFLSTRGQEYGNKICICRAANSQVLMGTIGREDDIDVNGENVQGIQLS